MSLTAPAWLVEHGGNLKLGSDGSTWFVLIGDQPNYSLKPVPVEGQFACAIRQTNNGRRLDSPAHFPTAEDALRNSLEELRKVLGWS